MKQFEFLLSSRMGGGGEEGHKRVFITPFSHLLSPQHKVKSTTYITLNSSMLNFKLYQ